MALPKHDIGLSSLAKAMGESIDNDIAAGLYMQLNQSPQIHSAITNPTPYPPPTISNSVPISKWEIKVEALKCETMITLEDWENHPTEWVKEKMLRLMLDEMMKKHFIEFTMNKDNHNMIRVRARIFVTPDEQVRILRVNGVI